MITSSTRSAALAEGGTGHGAGENSMAPPQLFILENSEWDLHLLRSLSWWAAHSHWPLGVRELSAPHSEPPALCRICPLAEVLLRARQDRGFSKRSAGLDHQESSKHNCQLLSEFIQSMVCLHLLSFASFSCSSKAVIFSDCNSTPGLKSPILRDLLALLWKAPTASYRRPQSFLFSVLGQ